MSLGAHSWRQRTRLDSVLQSICSKHRRFASRLNFQEIDAKWQQRWAEAPTGQTRPGKQSNYVLPMFAYPSGSLHMGHLRVYTITDVIARYRTMKGYDVLHPTGWDAFGLPAENAAIERGIDPAVWTEDNIGKMKAQLKAMNTNFNWDAEISTCSPSFYKHTQKLFLMLYKRGLAYQAEALVNYDPVDQTVLANEQVDANGRSWRSGALVQQLNLRQWFFRIKSYQEALLQDLYLLGENDKWPERVLAQQRNWLGKSKGAKIRFELASARAEESPVIVFTTRPDTLFGVTYLALSLSHPLVHELSTGLPELRNWLDKKGSFSPESKAGFELPAKAINPVSSESIPIFAAPYVLDGYGEGAVMGVPAHDSRDFAFWKQHRPEAPIPLVAQSPDSTAHDLQMPPNQLGEAFVGHGILTARCGKYAGMDSTAAAGRIVNDLAASGYAESKETWRLRDWLVSRQRYWGTPIPIVHCDSCGSVPVPDDELPVVLPSLPKAAQGQTGNPLDKIAEWVNCDCPQCGKAARRETDTMDTFVDSSWYYARFVDPHNDNEMFSKEAASLKLPVDTYVGGVEHAILHLLYARFIYKFLCDEGLNSSHQADPEPFSQLIAQGMVHGKTFSDPDTGRFLKPAELELTGEDSIIVASGVKPTVTWEKMSKSKHNGIAPSTCIEKYGADATRAHMLFAAPVGEVLQWDEDKVVGIQRWFGRVQRLCSSLLESSRGVPIGRQLGTDDISHVPQEEATLLLLTQETIRSVTRTLESDLYGLNTVISDLMKLTSALHDAKTEVIVTFPNMLSALLRMLAPIAPAFVEQCWEEVRLTESTGISSIFEASWPESILVPDAEATLRARRAIMTCAVQVNGKLRFTADVPAPSTTASLARSDREKQVLKAVLETEQGRLWLTEKHAWEKRKRVVLIGDGKLLNVVY